MIGKLDRERVLISGISGFIGSHLARRLVKEEAEVYGLVRESSNLWRISDIKNQISIYYADLKDFESVKNIIQDVQPLKIFHLAAYVDVSRSFAVLDNMVENNKNQV